MQEAKGLVTIKGRISSKYLIARIYGLEDEEKDRVAMIALELATRI